MLRKLNFLDYAYITLQELIECRPNDGTFALKGYSEADSCDDWASWSESFYADFSDGRLCDLLNVNEAQYGTRFVAAVRDIGRCSGGA